MRKSATHLANELLEAEVGGLEELRIYEFPDDESAHDDKFTERLYAEFNDEFDCVQQELSEKYGLPSHTGLENDEALPFSGVFRFAMWQVGNKQIFAAAAHEDRGAPILLMLGTQDSEIT